MAKKLVIDAAAAGFSLADPALEPGEVEKCILDILEHVGEPRNTRQKWSGAGKGAANINGCLTTLLIPLGDPRLQTGSLSSIFSIGKNPLISQSYNRRKSINEAHYLTLFVTEITRSISD
jgi:hypothetical protein